MSASKKTFADWENLLTQLSSLVSPKITLYEDFVAFTGVSTSLRSSAIFDHANAIPLPWLMLAPENGPGVPLEFFNLRTGKVLNVPHPETTMKDKRCLSSLGWLVTCNDEGVMEFLHPLSRIRIPLPHYSTLEFSKFDDQDPPYYFRKVALSARPSDGDFAIMMISGPNYVLSYWKPGVVGWTALEQGYKCFWDVIYYRGQFLAFRMNGDLVSVVIGESGNQITSKVVGEFVSHPERKKYLVEWCGELLVVTKHGEDNVADDRYWTVRFRVFRSDGSMTTWQQIDDLGGQSIFIGHNSSLCVPGAVAAGIKPDCIYFTDDVDDPVPNAGQDMGIYNLRTLQMEKHYQGNKVLSCECPPLWVTPTF